MKKPSLIQLKTSIFLLVALMMLNLSAIHANEPYAGWKQIRTEHFQLIFEPHDHAYAQEVASYADIEYLKLSKLLNHAPKEMIPVIIAGRTASANGYFSPFPARISIFVTSPSTRFNGSRTPDWLHSVFVHELTHYIHLTSPVGPPRFLAPIFGPDITTAMNGIFMPGWWLEGITTYTESEFSEGGRGDAPFFAMTYKAPLLDDVMWSLAQGAYQSAFPPSGRIYVAGYIFVEYLINRFGQDVFAQINSKFADLPFLGINRAIRNVTGFTAKELYQDMLDSRKTGFGPEIPSTPSVTFSPEIYGDYYLPYHTERGWIGWARTLGSGGAIVRYEKPGEPPTVLHKANITDPQSFAVNTAGTVAVLAASWNDILNPAAIVNTPVSYSDIYLMDLITGKTKRITNQKRLVQPAISADGSKIIATEVNGIRYRLVDVDVTTGQVNVLYENPMGSVYEPQISPDGKRIVAVEVVDGQSSLIILDDSGTVTYLWDHSPGGIYRPRIFNDGSILFGSDREGTLAVYAYDVNTNETTRIIQDRIGAFGAEIHDGEVVYATYSSHGYSLRHTTIDAIESRVVPNPTSVLPRPETPKTSAHFETKKYIDLPRPGLWLPLPIMDNNAVAPGVWVMLSSVLGRNQLALTAGWNFAESLPLGSLEYVHNPGWGSIFLSTQLNLPFGDAIGGIYPRQQVITANVSLPVWRDHQVDSRKMLSTLAQLQYRFRDSGDVLIGTAQVAYQHIGQGAAKAFFGRDYFGVTSGVNLAHGISSTSSAIVPYMSTAGQLPVFNTNQVVRLELDGMASFGAPLSRGNLQPIGGFDAPPIDADAKLRGTLLYRIPLGVLDRSIPYGGLLGAGLTAYAQSAAYLSSGSILWENDVYAGMEVSADLVIGALAQFRPKAGIAVSTQTGTYKFYFDFQIASIGIFPALPFSAGL